MLDLATYDFALPDQLIARVPANPRDSARLFVYDTAMDTIEYSIVRKLPEYLPANSLLVMNDTKVVPARVHVIDTRRNKSVEVLLFVNEVRPGDSEIKGIANRYLRPGSRVYFQSGAHLEVTRLEEQFFFFKPSITLDKLQSLLTNEGETPIPPYIRDTALNEASLREHYQSIFAREEGSVAAPTASLHFTDTLMHSLESRGVSHTFVTLHVGAGTFAPLTVDNFTERKLFTEYCAIDREAQRAINSSLAERRPVIPVGTTALRTLESFGQYHNHEYRVDSGVLATNIFIYPPYRFKIASGLLTNFHVPRSSLLLLVDALLEHKGANRRILDLYEIAIKEQFRFYSFGDAMLIL